jgi:hypothetical protein
MKTTLATLGVSGILVWSCYAQQYRPPVATNQTASEATTPNIPKAEEAAYYATLNQREIESNAQIELLNQLAQEHKKRAQDAPADQGPRSQWESDLAKELSDRAAATLVGLNKTTKERVAFEQKHPGFASPLLSNSAIGATNDLNPADIAFLAKLAERRTAVEQEIGATIQAANLYAAQIATNTGSYDSLRVFSLMQDNGYYLKQLQKDLFDIELKNLEFRALRRH